MSLISPILLAAGGWIYLAALFQYDGYSWAYNTCSGLYGICNNPSSTLFGAIASAAAIYVLDTIKSR